MAAAYSVDLRARVLRDADAGLSSKALAERYHVSRAWVDALKQRRTRDRIDRAPETNHVWRAGLGRSGGLLGGPDHGATGCDSHRIARRLADVGGPEHALVRDSLLGLHRQKKPSTPTSNVGLMSRRRAASGARGSRCATCASTSSSTNAA